MTELMRKLPKLRDGYHYRVIVRSGVPHLAICSMKVKGIFKKRDVRVVEFEIPILNTPSYPAIEVQMLTAAVAMKEVCPRFFLHEVDKSTIDQLNTELGG